MIPIGDERTGRTRPYVVYFLVAANILVFLAEVIGGMHTQRYSMVPMSVVKDIPYQVQFDQFGRMLVQKVTDGLHPQWVTIFTSMFLHASWLHVGSNMLYLWIFGDNIEDALGHFKFLLFYLLGGVAAAVAHIFISVAGGPAAYIPTVGASGAIAAVLGAYLYLYPRNTVTALVPIGFFLTAMDIPAILVLGLWFVIQLIGLGGTGGQLGGGVAYGAHIGGFVAGLILIILMGGRSLKRPPTARLQRYYDDGWR